ncbi:hypothetical protein NECID01_0303 [Nematocida sp. AWRm77]|nr:hypothetical protein NECID01_0303 [Nematocida sp. AWRm77]
MNKNTLMKSLVSTRFLIVLAFAAILLQECMAKMHEEDSYERDTILLKERYGDGARNQEVLQAKNIQQIEEAEKNRTDSKKTVGPFDYTASRKDKDSAIGDLSCEFSELRLRETARKNTISPDVDTNNENESDSESYRNTGSSDQIEAEAISLYNNTTLITWIMISLCCSLFILIFFMIVFDSMDPALKDPLTEHVIPWCTYIYKSNVVQAILGLFIYLVVLHPSITQNSAISRIYIGLVGFFFFIMHCTYLSKVFMLDANVLHSTVLVLLYSVATFVMGIIGSRFCPRDFAIRDVLTSVFIFPYVIALSCLSFAVQIYSSKDIGEYIFTSGIYSLISILILNALYYTRKLYFSSKLRETSKEIKYWNTFFTLFLNVLLIASVCAVVITIQQEGHAKLLKDLTIQGLSWLSKWDMFANVEGFIKSSAERADNWKIATEHTQQYVMNNQ